MPSDLNLESVTKRYLVQQAQSDLPIRKKRDNKTRGGKCLIVAGSSHQWGAGILCARAAARSGAGYVYLYDPQSKFPVLGNPEFLTIKSLKNLAPFNCVAVGPGLNNSRMILGLIHRLLKSPEINVVLDAEALNVLAKTKKKFKLPAHWVMTPHEGELSRLIGVPSSDIRRNRKKYILQAQKKWGAIIVLKGHKTLVANLNSNWEIQSGNSALAKAGTGDVLTGMIAAYLSQQVNPLRAACLAAFTHGLIADHWLAEKKDQLSLMASDMIEDISKVLFLIRKNRKIKP